MRFLPSPEATKNVRHVDKSGVSQHTRSHRRPIATGAVYDSWSSGVQLLDAVRQLTDRDRDRFWDHASLQFARVADVHKLKPETVTATLVKF